MTHPSDITNGASLEDCHTNFFALADLCGMKWRRWTCESSFCIEPLDDPVLASYSKCLAADILSVWRRVKNNNEQHRPHSEINQLSFSKELWIFWYNVEPDLSSFVHHDLIEADSGSWENGLSYECRTLLFKALHNLLERGLLTRGFSRLGRWFVKPYDCSIDKHNNKNQQLTFTFNFFVHGESTVCASVEVRQPPGIYKLHRNHLASAQESHSGVKVILGPYGLCGTLTGHSSKESDSQNQRFLQEWYQFYPMPAKESSYTDDDDEDELLPTVEVLIGGVKMRHPSSYTYLCEHDDANIAQGTGNSSNPSTILGPNNQTYNKPFQSVSNLLTPPTSPCDDPLFLKQHQQQQTPQNYPSNKIQSLLFTLNHSTTLRVKHSVWKDSTISSHFSPQSQPATPAAATGDCSSDEQLGQWDFCDPCSRYDCNCSRCKNKNQPLLKSGGESNSSSGSTPGSTTTSTTSTNKTERDKSQVRLKSMVAFHRRTQNASESASAVDLDNYVPSTAPLPPVPSTNLPPNNYQYKVPSVTFRSTTPNGLPQLFGQPSIIGSPHPPNTPTPLLEGPNSQMSSTDPTMPTLSPHPPPLRSEEADDPNLRSTESLDQAAPPSQSPIITLSEVKDVKPLAEQPATPYQLPLGTLLEANNTKSEPSPGTIIAPTEPQVTPPAPPPPPPPNKVSQHQGLKRPLLPPSSTEDPDDICRSGLLYDYSSIHSALLWEGLPLKRQHRMHGLSSSNIKGSAGSYFYKEGLLCTDGISSLHPLKPKKDPYEFNDEFDEDGPSSANFRNKLDIIIKEEEGKPGDCSATGEQAMVTDSTNNKPASNSGEAIDETSPPTPRNQGPSLTREEDLQVTEHDLEQLFDTSSDESAENFPPTGTPGSVKLPNTPEEPKTNKNNCPASILGNYKLKGGDFVEHNILITGAAELTRMFPTPPSLEHNTVQSPSCPLTNTDLTVLESGEYRDRTDLYPYSPMEAIKDWSYVYKPPVHAKFVGSSRYAPLTSLPSSNLAPINLSIENTYKVSWQNSGPQQQQQQHSLPPQQQQMSTTAASHHPDSSDRHQMMMMDTERHYGMDPSSIDQRSLNYELQSPASNASSYLNKHLNSIDNSSTVSSISETHSLWVSLLLSDSMLNMFKDHNFSSCTVCVCNMNIKGADAGLLLPSSLIPTGNDEPQYKCTCGFSAVVNRHRSYRSGLFYEDEVEITGYPYEPPIRPKKSLALVEATGRTNKKVSENSLEQVPHQILDLIKVQCSSLVSSCSAFFKSGHLGPTDTAYPSPNLLEQSDGCEISYVALESGKQAIDNISNTRMEDSQKSTCLHKWPYLPAKSPTNSYDMIQLLRSLQPLLQECLQKKRTQALWEVTYTVSGPLTWRQFHRLAGRGTEDQCEPQPIPSLLVGYDKDWLGVSPFALKFWDKLILEPSSFGRDVAYVVLAPDNDFILAQVQLFFKELSSVYEMNRLGRHCPITKVLRDGIMRVGKSVAKKLAGEPLDDWFNVLGDGPISTKLKLYAQACRHHLAPHLNTLKMDSSLLESASKPPDKAPVPSPMNTSNVSEGQEATQQKPAENEANSQEAPSVSAAPPPSTNPTPEEQDDDKAAPSLVIYFVEPFTFSFMDPETYRLAVMGLLHCFTQMLRFLPDHLHSSLHPQIISLDTIMCLGKGEDVTKRHDQIRSLAFNVYSLCQRSVPHQPTVKSLTGFGPAATQELFLRGKHERNPAVPLKLFSLPYILAPQKDKQTELGEMFGDRREKSNTLLCSYCLSEDQRWLLTSCTNDKGDMMKTNLINIEIPNRTRRKKASARKIGLHKLFDFLIEVMSNSSQPWRLVITRLGRLGHGELREWASLLGRKSLLCYSRRLKELCKQCVVLGCLDTPAILSACLVSLEPDSSLRILADHYTPDDRFSSSCNSCDLSTPQDATCTHILVFPTSATTQSSQATFQQEHIDPLSTTLGDDDIFQVLNEDDMGVDQDINDILGWTESPTQSPGGGNGSPHRDSQPGSPGGTGGRHSPFPHGGPLRSSGSMVVDVQDEPLQLLQQPLALGYYVSTAKTGNLPRWFWSSCPHLEGSCPIFLKSALLIHSPSVQQSSDDILHASAHARNNHPLDSNLTTDVLRYVLEGFNALSWLAFDSTSHDRRSCLPVHIQVLMQLYHSIEALV